MSHERFDRGRFITVYGRMPVLEALADETLAVAKVILARTARGDSIDDIVALADRRGITLERADATRVTKISRNGRQDQGVVADVSAPGLGELTAWLAGGPASSVVLLDGVTNPANVGLVIRTATAAGLPIALPRFGVPDVGPLVVKASAGVAFKARILRTPTAFDGAVALRDAGFEVVGLRAEDAPSLFGTLPARSALVFGGETAGVSDEVAELVTTWRSIPLAGGVESLNIAVAAGIACFELVRATARRR